MAAGRLRQQLVIQRPTETADGAGGVTTSWSTLATVWGSLEPLRGSEYVEARGAQGEMVVRIRMRYRSDVTAKMRVAWGSRVFEVQAALFDAKRIYSELMCIEVV